MGRFKKLKLAMKALDSEKRIVPLEEALPTIRSSFTAWWWQICLPGQM